MIENKIILLLKEISIKKYNGRGHQKKLSDATGLTSAQISNVFSLNYDFTFKTFVKICNALEVDFNINGDCKEEILKANEEYNSLNVKI